MITRGKIIGKIVDDLSILQVQIEMRCKLGLTDLNKYCEDFIRDVLNIAFDLNMKNLNSSRSNEPGLDLGDRKKKIAYQVTSTNTSEKVNKTLKKISSEQLDLFKVIKIFVLGKKQGSYSAINADLKSKCNFSDENIQDISDLCRQIISLGSAELHELNKLFEREFQTVLLEFEVPDKKGKYPTALSDKLEVIPNSICQNAGLYLTEYSESTAEEIRTVFNKWAQLPRVTREFLEIIIKIGEKDNGNFQIDYNVLIRKLDIQDKKINEEIGILVSRHLLTEPDEEDSTFSTLFDDTMASIIEFSVKQDCLSKVLVALDFRLLDT